MKIYGAGEIDNGQFPVPFEVKYIDGATMLARRAFWSRFAGFREEYFMYGDSLELCARVLRTGRKMAIVPKAKAYHFEPEKTSLIPEIEFHKLKNFFSLYLLHAPGVTYRSFSFAMESLILFSLALGKSEYPLVPS